VAQFYKNRFPTEIWGVASFIIVGFNFRAAFGHFANGWGRRSNNICVFWKNYPFWTVNFCTPDVSVFSTHSLLQHWHL